MHLNLTDIQQLTRGNSGDSTWGAKASTVTTPTAPSSQAPTRGTYLVTEENGSRSSPQQPKSQTKMAANDVFVCNQGDLKDGEMREVEVAGGKVLLTRDKGEYYAVGPKCTHYGAPLANGVLCNGRVRCPWHGACFNVKTGDIEDFPGLNSLPTFEVSVRDSKVYVKADAETVKKASRVKSMVKHVADNKQTFVLVGGGPATVECAETLRQEGFTGKVVIVTREKHLPYDRPKLSKAMDIKPEAIALRDADFYKSHDIEIQMEKEVVSVDSSGKSVKLSDGGSVQFDKLLIATGGKPRTLPIPGLDLQNVCQLRTPGDANYIASAAQGKKVVIIGSSFIGMEVASCLAEKAESVSVVDLIKVPFQLTLGDKVGAALQKMHEDKGVKFYFERSVKEFVGEDGKVTEAILSDGTKLEADLCVLGIGVVPATDFLKDSGITMTTRGFITVDKSLQTNMADIYAAGDIVEFPLFTAGDQQANIQHWQMAHQHGHTAALNMLGKTTEVHSVPFFWTVQYGKSVRYTGYGPGYDDVVVHGDLEAPKFVAFYTKGETVVAVASLAFDPIVSQAAQLMLNGGTITKEEIKDDPKSWTSRLQKF
ncbi:apoptosis-inducing factor 3-like isoform X1 [Haliotis rufescens]|uniref:apoptosis-inducing factor 3-like isoform X1 n=1 Tax=Haliotis rufescens TaxID=6454 RepID=UPI00201F3FF5|nr:apoptosis-inducing factor 3-like isoform X1 [Haliotis rufescens]